MIIAGSHETHTTPTGARRTTRDKRLEKIIFKTLCHFSSKLFLISLVFSYAFGLEDRIKMNRVWWEKSFLCCCCRSFISSASRRRYRKLRQFYRLQGTFLLSSVRIVWLRWRAMCHVAGASHPKIESISLLLPRHERQRMKIAVFSKHWRDVQNHVWTLSTLPPHQCCREFSKFKHFSWFLFGCAGRSGEQRANWQETLLLTTVSINSNWAGCAAALLLTYHHHLSPMSTLCCHAIMHNDIISRQFFFLSIFFIFLSWTPLTLLTLTTAMRRGWKAWKCGAPADKEREAPRVNEINDTTSIL